MDDEKRGLWTKVIADCQLSGLTQRAFAEQKQIEVSSLRYWMYKLRNESRPLVVKEQAAYLWAVGTRPGSRQLSQRSLTSVYYVSWTQARDSRWPELALRF